MLQIVFGSNVKMAVQDPSYPVIHIYVFLYNGGFGSVPIVMLY
jgi:hypothetical protein